MIQSLLQKVAPRLEFIWHFNMSGYHLFLLCNINYTIWCKITWGTRWQQAKVCRRNDGQIMARFMPGCNEKHRREMKMKHLNPAEERLSCKLRWLEPSEWEFNGEYNSGNCIFIGLTFLELGKVLWTHTHTQAHTHTLAVRKWFLETRHMLACGRCALGLKTIF